MYIAAFSMFRLISLLSTSRIHSARYSQGIQISTDSGSLATLVPLPLAAGPVAIASNAAVPSGLPAGNYKGARARVWGVYACLWGNQFHCIMYTRISVPIFKNTVCAALPNGQWATSRARVFSASVFETRFADIRLPIIAG